jgi:CheY-like chemotaxis protein
VTHTVLMLEDDAERLIRFRAAAERLGIELVVWRDAHRMIAEVETQLAAARLISLDHDLEPERDTDPGDGLDVAKHLANLPPVCPVIIHTSNGARGDAMAGEFELAGWRHHRVMPLGDDWIEVDWFRAVRRALRGKPSGK